MGSPMDASRICIDTGTDQLLCELDAGVATVRADPTHGR
jgi:hypothetical protein